MIELGIVAVAAVLISLFTQYLLNFVDFSIPGVPEAWPALALLYSGLGIRLAWCFTSDSD